jgi:hypothetical protein
MAMSGEDDRRQDGNPETLRGYHQALLEAMKQREVDIIKFLAILGLALGGFVWLCHQTGATAAPAMVVGVYGVLLALFAGALYALALGYNYRCLTMQVAKLERDLNIKKSVLRGWPRACRDFERRFRWGAIPWSSPPEIIKVFWLSLLLCILLVTAFVFGMERGALDAHPGNAGSKASEAVGVGSRVCSASDVLNSERTNAASGSAQNSASLSQAQRILMKVAPWIGLTFFVIAGAGPVWVGRRLLRLCRDELRYGESEGWGKEQVGNE